MTTEQKRKHIAQGLCQSCSKPALPDKTRCEKHNSKHLARELQRMNWRRDNGRCVKCGAVLIDDMDSGFAGCIFCRERIPKGDANAVIFTRFPA